MSGTLELQMRQSAHMRRAWAKCGRLIRVACEARKDSATLKAYLFQTAQLLGPRDFVRWLSEVSPIPDVFVPAK